MNETCEHGKGLEPGTPGRWEERVGAPGETLPTTSMTLPLPTAHQGRDPPHEVPLPSHWGLHPMGCPVPQGPPWFSQWGDDGLGSRGAVTPRAWAKCSLSQ